MKTGAFGTGDRLTENTETSPEQPAAQTPEPSPSDTAPPVNVPSSLEKKRRRHAVLRVFGVLMAIVAAVVVSGLVIDLGPSVRKRAEDAGSKYLERPMHIGRLGIHLGRGAFVVDDLVIEGLNPTDRPFLKAKRIFVNLPWWTIFTRELIVENVDMND